MERIRWRKINNKLLAVIVSVSVFFIAFMPAASVRSWAADYAGEYYCNSLNQDANGNALIYVPGGPEMGSTSGTIPSGSVFFLMHDYNLPNAGSFSNCTVYGNGKVYVFNKSVNFQCNGTTINLSAVAGAVKGTDAVEEKKDDKKDVVIVEKVGPTPEQIAWAQYHDHRNNSNDAGFVWNVQQEATEYSDGVAILQCPDCGYTETKAPIAAGDIFITNTVRRIKAANSGQKIHIDALMWSSFSKEIIDALREKTNVTFDITFIYQKKIYDMTIPAGADYSNVTEEQSKGLLTLAGELGVVATPR